MRKPQRPRSSSSGEVSGSSSSQHGTSYRPPSRRQPSQQHRVEGVRRRASFRPTVQREDLVPQIPSARDMGAELSERRVLNLNARLKEKKSYRRKLVLKKLSIYAGCVLLIAFLVWLFLFSSAFRFSSHSVTINGIAGDSLIRQEDVHAVLDQYDGTALLLMRSSMVEQSLEEIPEVKEAKVRRSFPHGLKVDVTTQKPFMCWGTSGNCTFVAEDGSQLRVSASKKFEVPILSVEDKKRAPEIVMKSISSFYHQLDTSLQSQIASVALSESGQISFTLDNNAEIFWGTLDQPEMKKKVLAALLTQGHQYYDVSVPSSPVTK